MKKFVGRGLDCLFASVLRYIPAKFVKIWRAIRSTLTGLANRNLKPQLPVANTITSKSVGARYPRNPCYELGPNRYLSKYLENEFLKQVT